jgi:uncharacterized damage-inducible protein DinB
VTDVSIRPFYADWAGYNRRTTEALGKLSAADLALTVPGSDHWPIWALFAHVAGARVYWLCRVLGEPGIETTPFPNPETEGWEDDLSTPRSAGELVDAYESSWRIIAGCLARWTPAMLDEPFRRQRDAAVQIHTRESVVLRLINHEAFHLGEINLTLGTNGRKPIDLWPAADWLDTAPAALREG